MSTKMKKRGGFSMVFKRKEKVSTYVNGEKVPDKVPELDVPLPPDCSSPTTHKLNISSGCCDLCGKTFEEIRQELDTPVFSIDPPEEPAPQQPTEADQFEGAREYGFLEGVSFSIATLRRIQNDLIKQQQGR